MCVCAHLSHVVTRTVVDEPPRRGMSSAGHEKSDQEAEAKGEAGEREH